MNSFENQPSPTDRNPIALPLGSEIVGTTRELLDGKDTVSSEDLPEVELADHERTPEGLIELSMEHVETQKFLLTSLKYDCSGAIDSWPPRMQQLAHEAIAKFNDGRVETVLPEQLSPDFLFKLATPNWVDEAKDGGSSQWPEDYQPDLDYLQELTDKLTVLSQDEQLKVEAGERWRERTEVMRTAGIIHHREHRLDQLAREIAKVRMESAKKGHPKPSTAKERKINKLEATMSELQAGLYAHELPDQLEADLVSEIERQDRKALRREFEQGLVLTDSMTAIIDSVVVSLVKGGKPALFVGETGGAKTALAEYIAREVLRKEPEIVSGYADVNGYQLMGKTGLEIDHQRTSWNEVLQNLETMGVDWEHLSDGERAQIAAAGISIMHMPGSPESVFLPGPVVRAMEEGRPLILDEVNAMPTEFLKRLNIVMQLKPGQTYSIQENSGKVITVKDGFCVMATANEKSERYTGVNALSAEFKNRFTENTYRIGYPDADVVIGQEPLDNYKLAYASVSDKTGEILFTEGTDVLEAFAKAAHMTQRLFSGHINEGLSQSELDVVGTDRLRDSNASGLDENVLAPRTMVAILEKAVDSQGGLTLAQVLSDWVDSIKNQHDKKVITTILQTRGLINVDASE